jgi:hypothetical protein
VKQLSELALSFLTTPTMVDLGLYEEGKGALTFLALAETSVQKAASEQFIYEGVTVFKGFEKDNEVCIGQPWVKKPFGVTLNYYSKRRLEVREVL